MSQYYFLPYLRQGLAGIITTPDAMSTSPAILERANISINVPVRSKAVGGTTETVTSVSKQFKLKGPGDVIGINSNEIVKISPKEWDTNMEPNYLPFIEFYEEDFPWRYTPAAAVENAGNQQYKLRPWVSLVVLKEDEFEMQPFNGILPSFKTQQQAGNIFPDPTQMWAWAHVHVNDNLEASGAGINNAKTKMKDIIDNDPDKAISRLLCPRRLEANTGYYAFLIPTFETGRLAGIGSTNAIGGTDSLAPSWLSASPSGREFPIYYQWFFKTASGGTFESMVRQLVPRAIPSTVGKKPVDMQLPGDPALDLQAPYNTIGLPGVLQPPLATPDPWVDGSYTTAIKGILNRTYNFRQGPAPGGNPDPVIGPPIYGQWHANADHLSGTMNANWINSANLEPRYRMFAGAGAELVRKNQDKYMQLAWQQVGEVIEANRKLRLLQLSVETSNTMNSKHIAPLSNESVLGVTGAVHAKVSGPSGSASVYKEIGDSVVPNSMFSGAFRRVTRPGGPLMRSMELAGTPTSVETMIADVNNGSVALSVPYTPPAAMMSYNTWSSSQLTASYTQSLPTVSNFAITAPAASYASPAYGPPSAAATAFVNATAALHAIISSQPAYVFNSLPTLSVSGIVNNVKGQTNPATAIKAWAINHILQFTPVTETPTASLPTIRPILAAPQFNIPVYKEVAAMSVDWIMPGLNTIAQNSINALVMRQENIEALMLGLNHEMSRELLWRGYPTDQRGTYFSFFWGCENSQSDINPNDNLDSFKDIWPIHQWRPSHSSTGTLSQIGSNSHRTTSNPDLLILVVRGEIFKKFPNTRVYMQQAQWKTNTQTGLPDYTTNRVPVDNTELLPVFTATMDPDIYFLAFDIKPVDARGSGGSLPGYFFVFEQHAIEMRFGADEIISTSPNSNVLGSNNWNDLNWSNIKYNSTAGFIDVTDNRVKLNNPQSTDLKWGSNSANMANILMQFPVKMYIHAHELIQP